MKNETIILPFFALILGIAVWFFAAAMPIFASEGSNSDTENPTEVDYDAVKEVIMNSGEEVTFEGQTYTRNEAGAIVTNDGESLVYPNPVASFGIYKGDIIAAVENEGKTEFIVIGLDGTPLKTLFTLDGRVDCFSIKDGRLYYLLDETVYNQEGEAIVGLEGLLSFSLRHDCTMSLTSTAGFFLYDAPTKTMKKVAEYSEKEENSFETSATVFTPRLEAPTSGNQYYFSSKNPFYPDYGMPNCTAYAYGRAYEILKTKPNLCTRNAGKWYDYNKNGGFYPYGSTPKLGAIAVWANDSSHDQGHVAVVEKINANGSVTISESYYGSTFFKVQTAHIKNLYTSKTFLGFIYVLGDGVDSNVVAEPTLSAADTAGGKNISLACATGGATIYYTTDGKNPTTSSKKYTGPFKITSYTTVKAMAVKSGYSNSPIMTKSINITSTSAPTANIASGSLVATNSKILLSSATAGATIYYTTDGSTPTTSSTKYAGGVTITQSMTIKAIAVKSGLLASTVSTFQYFNWTSPFDDIKSGLWYFNDVAEAYDNGYISGVGNNKFAPSGTTTRAMFVTILSRLDSTHDITNYESEFRDVPSGQWYSDAIAWANVNGIVSGMGNGLFSPNAPITREQVCVIMVKYSEYQNVSLSSSISKVSFSDEMKISSYAKSHVSTAQQAGLICGNPNGAFYPQGKATRAEVTSIIMRMVRLYL